MKEYGDNSTVFRLLELHQQLPSEFSQDHCRLYQVEEMNYLLIYEAASRNFQLFEFSGCTTFQTMLTEMLAKIDSLSAEKFSIRFLESVQQFIENEFRTKQNQAWYFDAH